MKPNDQLMGHSMKLKIGKIADIADRIIFGNKNTNTHEEPIKPSDETRGQTSSISKTQFGTSNNNDGSKFVCPKTEPIDIVQRIQTGNKILDDFFHSK